jgi:Fe-S-cluster containining protein
MPQPAELCTDCGICCDGTLFSSVSLDAHGLTAARKHRLPLLETRDAIKLELPCPALRGVLCGIYEERPEACADYACELLIGVDEAELEFDDARRIIEATRAIRTRVSEAIGTTPWWTARRSAREAAQKDPTWARDNAELLADLDELEQLVQQHFWG